MNNVSRDLRIKSRELVQTYRPFIRDKVKDLEDQTVEITRRGDSLVPLMAEQRRFVLDLCRKVYGDLQEVAKIPREGFSGFVSGGYARESCVFGVDLDLGMMYDEAQRARFFPLKMPYSSLYPTFWTRIAVRFITVLSE